MAGRPKDIWLALVGRTGLTMLSEGMRVQVRISLAKFPGRDVHLNLTVADARKWADALNHYADKMDREYSEQE
jgi:GTPase Era involved in 16S rRNA processing